MATGRSTQDQTKSSVFNIGVLSANGEQRKLHTQTQYHCDRKKNIAHVVGLKKVKSYRIQMWCLRWTVAISQLIRTG